MPFNIFRKNLNIITCSASHFQQMTLSKSNSTEVEALSSSSTEFFALLLIVLVVWFSALAHISPVPGSSSRQLFVEKGALITPLFWFIKGALYCGKSHI